MQEAATYKRRSKGGQNWPNHMKSENIISQTARSILFYKRHHAIGWLGNSKIIPKENKHVHFKGDQCTYASKPKTECNAQLSVV